MEFYYRKILPHAREKKTENGGHFHTMNHPHCDFMVNYLCWFVLSLLCLWGNFKVFRRWSEFIVIIISHKQQWNKEITMEMVNFAGILCHWELDYKYERMKLLVSIEKDHSQVVPINSNRCILNVLPLIEYQYPLFTPDQFQSSLHNYHLV